MPISGLVQKCIKEELFARFFLHLVYMAKTGHFLFIDIFYTLLTVTKSSDAIRISNVRVLLQ